LSVIEFVIANILMHNKLSSAKNPACEQSNITVLTHRKMISTVQRIKPSNKAFGPKHFVSTFNKLGFLLMSLALSNS
jgi:hypothetical protein